MAAHLLLRLLETDARLDPRQHLKGVASAVRQLTLCEDERHPEFDRGGRVLHGLRHHANHLILLAAEQDVAPHQPRVGAVTPPPEPVAQHDDALAPRLIFAFEEASPGLRRRAEHLEEVRRDLRADGAHRLLLLAQVEVAVLVGGDSREGVRLRAPVQKIRDGDRAGAALRQSLVDRDEPAGLRVGQRTQEYRVDDREDGRVAANAERQRQHGDGRKPRLAPQHAETVPQVF